MKTRIVTATIALALFIPVLFFSESIIFVIILGLAALLAAYEFARCIKFDGSSLLLLLPFFVLAFLLPFVARYQPPLLKALIVLAFLYSLFLPVISNDVKKTEKSIWFFFGFVYFAVASSLIVLLRDREPVRYLLIFISAWSTDTFAYFGGVTFGKKKLCPKISPNKTIAGAIFGVLGSVIAFAAFWLITGDETYSIYSYLLVAIPVSLVAQLGDLAASTIKRYLGIKDFGKLFPGHGGVLDRLDSIFALTFAFYILLEFI